MPKPIVEFIEFESMFFTIGLAQRMIGIDQFFKRTDRKSFANICKRFYLYALYINLTYSSVSSIYNWANIIATKNKEKYIDAAELMPCSLITLLVYVKVFRIIFRTGDVVTVLEQLKKAWPKKNSSSGVLQIMISNLKPAKKLVNFYTIHTVFNIVCFFSSPFVLSYFLESEDEARISPFKLVYPFDFQNSDFRYSVVLVSQFLSVFATAFSMSIMDCFIIIVMVQLATHFEILSEQLSSLPRVTKPAEPSPTELEHINTTINTIIEKHIHVMEICDLVQKILGPLFLAIFLLSSILICQMLFFITIAPLNKQMNFFGLLLSLLIQVFLICYYGNKIVEQSELVCEAAYGCDWCSCDRSLRAKVLVLMRRAQTPVVLSAVGYSHVSLPTFSKIMNASWSYFTLLQAAAAETDL